MHSVTKARLVPFLFAFGRLAAPRYNAPTSGFIARFGNYTAGNNPRNDSGGGWAAAGYGGWTRETVWTRRMVLTAEGALVVLDKLDASEQDGGWLGGPLWQLNLASNCTGCLRYGNCTRGAKGKVPTPAQCNLTAPEGPDDDWFDLRGFEITTQPIDRYRGQLPERLNLVAKFANGDGGSGTGIGGGGGARTHGSSPGWLAPSTCPHPSPRGGCDWKAQNFSESDARLREPWGNGFPWQTLWSKQRIGSNGTALFVSVFVPYKAAGGRGAAAAVASSVEIETRSGIAQPGGPPEGVEGATVKLTPHGGAPLVVRLDVEGNWSVRLV